MSLLRKIRNNWILVALFCLIGVGIILRTYNLESWLFFQSDQMRDLNLVNRAVTDGPGWLPLLGPKAGGTYLRLGPIFYYFEYLSALLFGTNSPAIMVIPDLLFSLLSLPLLFLFLREFFSKKYALLLTAGYVVCFFEIQYARFAWNPNPLPFFNLLFFYALFKLFQVDNNRAKTWWVILAGVAYAVASQLHFVSLLSLPIAMGVIFLVRKFFFKNKKENWWKYLGIIILICVIFYLPVILSDLQSHGNNALNFLKSFGQKSSGSVHLLEALTKDIFVFSKYFLVILTGVVDASKQAINWFIFVLFLFFSSGIFLFKTEKNAERKFFIALVFVWFFSYFITYFPLGSKLQPRHFLTILPLPFIFFGFMVCGARKILKFKRMPYIAIAILLIPIVTNAYSVNTWFSEIADSQIKISKYRKSALLKSVGGESWWHLEKMARFMHADCDQENIVIVPPKQSYRSLLDYVMRSVGEKRAWSIRWGSIVASPATCFYAISFSKNDISNRFGKQIEEVRLKQFGDMSIRRFEFSADLQMKEVRNAFRKSEEEELSALEFLNSDNEAGDAEALDIESDVDLQDADLNQSGISELVEKVGRKNRIFWKDLFEE
ncbi:MAG: glycosyltransferase family 39 protein [Candidatus Moraniibacteriota bacterium]